jgi:hypothetical protein
MILLWGLLEDDPMDLAHAALHSAAAEFYFLDHQKILSADIECRIGPPGPCSCILTDGAEMIDLTNVKAAYVRGFNLLDYPELKGKDYGDPMVVRAAGFERQLINWLDSSAALLLNRSEPSASNNSKPFQLSVIEQVGFRIPQTLITNDAETARKFLSENCDSVYKSISGVRSIVRKISDARLESLQDVRWCPTLFQRVVPGTNYRAHVIGTNVLAVRIESTELDYRYGRTSMNCVELPPDVARRCVDLTRRLGLEFSGIDLMRTPDDHWYCFEVNPSPGYSYFERASGAPISAVLAKFLMLADGQAVAETA